MVFGMPGREAATYDRRRLIAQFSIVTLAPSVTCQMFAGSP
jgi:hypothetical protein